MVLSRRLGDEAMAQERDIALGVMQIAVAQSNDVCTFRTAYREIPNNVNLSAANLAPSVTRPGEPMWHQIVRNIKSHDQASGNFIVDGPLVHVPRTGYKITDAGARFLRQGARHP
jgi:hypothetical protein